MGRNILVINVDIRETRVALIENGIIAELHLERESSKGTLGNIYLGKVSRVLPGMQAAFIDVGLERAAFLHVEDLIRPDDFEAYLQGHRRGSEEERETRSSDDHEHTSQQRSLIDADDVPLLGHPGDDDDALGDSAAADHEPLPDDPVADEVAEEVGADADSVYSAASEVLAHEAALEDAEAAAAEAGDFDGPLDGDSGESRNHDIDDDAYTDVPDAPIMGEARPSDTDADAEMSDAEMSDANGDVDRDIDRDIDGDATRDIDGDGPDADAGPADFDNAPAEDVPPPLESGVGLTADAMPNVFVDSFAEADAEADAEGISLDALSAPNDEGPVPPAADAPEQPADGDTAITVAQDQRRRRGNRRDRVRRSRSTRDRLPEGAAAAPEEAPRPEPAPRAAPPRGESFGRPEPRGEGRGDSRGRQSGGRNDGDRGRRGDRRDGRDSRDRRDDRRPQPGGGPFTAPQQQRGQHPGAPRRDNRRGDRRDTRFDARPDNRDRGDNRGENRDRAHGHIHDRPTQRGRNYEPPRISKATPIREVVREGQEVLVQISKEPIGTKGARVTSHISLPGRYVVYLPTVDHIGISKRIGSEKERQRLREAIESMKPPQGGLIVRTVAEGLTKKQLKADVGYLVRLWGEVVKKRETDVRAPACLYSEVDLVLKTARDLFTDDIEKIVIDNRDEYFRLKRFIEMFMPERIDAIELYEGEEPIFDAYGIEDEIQRALARKVPLPSGGYLIIDQAEALTAIDVNTGRFVGKGSKDLEETILATNLEAVEEIAYQLRFRNIGGLIILDLIDMERPQNREKVRRRMEELLAKDKAKTTLNRISELGLIEMTRKRTRESLGRTVLEPCFYCDGTGQLQSKQTIAYEILRQIRRERENLPGYVIILNAHPAIIDLLKNEERASVTEAERLFQRRIELVPRKEYHLEQFDLQGK
ncbi:MAG: Rne/Rng family ribonuclease [Polyangiaceae bacterium]|nr:Rne/Rng family ribonuclease [Polyangiaceae bacterium]